MAAGASTLLAETDRPAEGVMVTLFISGKLNIKTGMTIGTINGTVAAHAIDGAAASAGLDALVTSIKVPGNGVTGLGYEIKAFFSEDNMRKANIAGRTSKQSMFYEIRPGRTYQLDYAINQQNAAESISIMANILRIGQGKRTLNTVEETLNYILGANNDIELGKLDPKYGPARKYVAGARVRPHVLDVELDITTIVTNNDMNQSENIRARAIVVLNSIVSELAGKTFLHQQVAGNSAIHYRAVTSNEVLDNVLSQNSGADKTMILQENKGAIEHSIILPCGVIIDVVTTTEKAFSRKIMMYPIFSPAESELNFGQNWNYGQFSGHYPVSGTDRSNNNRIYTSTREQVVPTNPMGAIVTVVGLETAVFSP